MTDLTEMVEWVRREIERDKAAAEVCAGVPWVIDVPPMIHVDAKAISENRHAWRKLGYVGSAERDHDRQHIVRHDPRDTIARCEAELAIIELCQTETSETGGRPLAVRTLRKLAHGYRFREGWRESWTS